MGSAISFFIGHTWRERALFVVLVLGGAVYAHEMGKRFASPPAPVCHRQMKVGAARYFDDETACVVQMYRCPTCGRLEGYAR